MGKLLSKTQTVIDSPLYGKYVRTDFEWEGKFWEGPTQAGQEGRYRTQVSNISHARGVWQNCNREYAERHGLVKHV